MDSAILVLLIVIHYKASKGVVEYGIIKGTRIFGFITLSLNLLVCILRFIFLKEDTIKTIFSVIETIVLFILLINIKKHAEKTARKEERRWW